MTHTRLLIIALLAAAPSVASAQFTTFIPPRTTATDSVKAVVAAAQVAQADTAAAVRLATMQAWVDSAAGLAPVPTSSADSLAADSLAKSPPDSLAKLPADSLAVSVAQARPDTMTFPNGARAPATASSLPLLLFTGGMFVIVGAMLLRRPKPARKRV